MKANIRKMLLAATIVIAAVTSSMAQRIIKGTVYRDGEPAAGITVEAHKGSTMMTSFDGKYKVEADEKTKWIKIHLSSMIQKNWILMIKAAIHLTLTLAQVN